VTGCDRPLASDNVRPGRPHHKTDSEPLWCGRPARTLVVAKLNAWAVIGE
jgi:hypothetical protein